MWALINKNAVFLCPHLRVKGGDYKFVPQEELVVKIKYETRKDGRY